MKNQSLSAAGCEGQLAWLTRRECKYDLEQKQEREEWADGFMFAASEHRAGKAWWKSRTVLVGIALAVVGVSLFFVGQYTDETILSFAGGALTVRELLGMFLRTITNQPVYMGSSYAGTVPPFIPQTR